MNPFQVVKDFEQALSEYTGAPYVVTTTSCTMALLLAVAWHLRDKPKRGDDNGQGYIHPMGSLIEIPKRTYVGVPMSIIHAGGRPTFRDQEWRGLYQLEPLLVWDAARLFTSGMYKGERDFGVIEKMNLPNGARGEITLKELADYSGHMQCLSFHWNKTLGIQQGGAILHDDPEADRWLRMARFDGRQEGVAPKDQKEWIIGHHCYMAPETAAAGLVRLSHLPRHNEPLPNDEYPDLSTFDIFE